MVRYRNVAINNKGRHPLHPPPHPPRKKKSFFSIGTSENCIKSGIWASGKRNSTREVICFLFIEQEKQIKWIMMDLLSHRNNRFLCVAGVSVLTIKRAVKFSALAAASIGCWIKLLAFNIKHICWYMIHVHAHDNSRAGVQNIEYIGCSAKFWIQYLSWIWSDNGFAV